MSDLDYKEFTIDFEYGGSAWCTSIHARSFAEAEDKLAALKSTGKITSYTVAKIPFGAPMWLTRLWLRWGW